LVISPFVLEGQDYTFLYIGIGIVVLLTGMVFFVRYNAGKTYDRNPDAFNMSYRVDETMLTYIVPEGEIQKKWDEFHSVYENEDYLYLYVNKNSGLVFVKSQVNTDITTFIIKQVAVHLKPKNIKVLQK
jgi:hypothetical protein